MLSRIFLFFVFLTVSLPVLSQKKDEFKQPRILILLDGSSSMVNDWVTGKSRFSSAGEIVLRLMDSIYQINDQVEFALRVYGHEHGVPENNCFDTRREVMFSKNNYTQMSLRLASLHPIGVSPIAYSLKVAAENDFVNERDYAYSLVLITDGGESCGGNICDVVKTLLEKKIEFKPYIVSLVDYAPLREQYNCLGNYLTVSKPAEVPAAIHTIAEAYRKVLAIPVAKPKLLQTANIPSPSVQKISVPAVKVPVNPPETSVVTKKTEAESKPQPVKTEATKPPVVTTNPTKIRVDTSFFTKEEFTALKSLGFERINYPLFWSTVTPKKRQVPVFSSPARETEPVAVNPPVTTPPKPPAQPTAKAMPKTSSAKSAAPAKNEVKEAAFTIKTEPAPETMLEIYFTDGKGRYYSTTPPMQLLDAKTGAAVKRFYRTVDASGHPDPQKVDPGNYTLMIGKTGNYKTKNITVQGASTNKITILVTKGTITFAYDDNTKRPVKEFSAAVRKTFEAGTNIYQKCTEEREYEPGNYHIEINTLPMMVRNLDLDFGLSYTVYIHEPGFVQFINTNPLGKVSLWAPLGDQFAKFYSLDLNGKAENQNLRLQPGVYEVHWKKDPSHPAMPEAIQRFYVKSNETTEVEIK